MNRDEREFGILWCFVFLLMLATIWLQPFGRLSWDVKFFITCLAVQAARFLVMCFRSAICRLGFHRWDPCVCFRGGCNASRGHLGSGCKCQRCGQIISSAHHYTTASPCICLICGHDNHVWETRWDAPVSRQFCKYCGKHDPNKDHVSHPSGVV